MPLCRLAMAFVLLAGASATAAAAPEATKPKTGRPGLAARTGLRGALEAPPPLAGPPTLPAPPKPARTFREDALEAQEAGLNAGFYAGLGSGLGFHGAAALPAAPARLGLRAPIDPAPICRAECAKARLVCAQTEDTTCDAHWSQCVRDCSLPTLD